MSDDPIVAITDAHEERLQRLEQVIPEFSAQLATQTAAIQRVNEVLEDSFKTLNIKIDSNFTPLAEQIKTTMQATETQEKRLGALERVEDTRQNRNKALTKYIKIGGIGAGGILGTKLVEYAWTFISRLF